MRSKTLSIGSISSGTLNPEDLIPIYCDELDRLHLARKDRSTLRKIQKNIKLIDYYSSETSTFDMEELDEMLDDYCPAMCYCGGTVGNGSDIGVWPIIDTDLILSTDEVDKIPSDCDSAYVINERGNTSYYIRKNRKLQCVWSVV